MAEAPLSAEEIVHRGFPSTFRGFDPAEVRAYLVRVAGELRAAHGRESELKQKLIEAERRAANPVIDQDMLTKALGEETSRVLASAQEAARQLQSRAEEGVARILREAHEQAQQIRVAAEVVLADRTEEADAAAAQIRGAAQAEAAALVEQARGEAEAARAEVVEEARQLVHEAQAARARVLGDLARRRRIAHTQVEQLRAGRERLLEAYRVVRRTLDEVADELERVESEARTAAGAAARRVEAALEAGDDPGEVPGEVASTEAGAEASALASAPLPEPALSTPAASIEVAPAATSTVEGARGGELPAPAPAPPSEPAPAPIVERSTRPFAARTPPAPVPPVVAREERAEERKLSSLRILRRPKTDDVPAAELEALEGRSEVEGVRLIPAEAEPASRPPASLPGTEREQPSVMPGVSWAPKPAAEPASSPAPPASNPSAASIPPASSASVATPPPAPASTAPPLPMRPSPVPDAGTPASGPVAVDLAAVPEDRPAADVQNHQSSGAEPASPVEALFARIRADRAGATARPAEGAEPAATSTSATDEPSLSGSAPSVDVPVEPTQKQVVEPPAVEAPPGQEESLLQQRDEALETIETALARKLKRALQDEHNDVLDRLRSCKGAPSVPAFLPTPAEQAARYADAAGELLAQAARSGLEFASPGAAEIAAPEVTDVVADLTEALVGPLRRGVERGVESGQEDTSLLADTIGAAYRECKSQRLERLAGDATIAAFSRGTVSATAGADLRWVVDDGDVACPDCDDNALAGPTPSGHQYPTGQSHPPAHAGCRCLLIPGRP